MDLNYKFDNQNLKTIYKRQRKESEGLNCQRFVYGMNRKMQCLCFNKNKRTGQRKKADDSALKKKYTIVLIIS